LILISRYGKLSEILIQQSLWKAQVAVSTIAIFSRFNDIMIV